jgi:hypothetical protein
MMEKQLPANVTATTVDESVLAKVILSGDLTDLSETEQASYVIRLCQRLKLDPTTQPFRLLKQQVPSPSGGKKTQVILYATKNATEQLCAKWNISTELSEIDISKVNETQLCRSTCKASLPEGRFTSAIGAVSMDGLRGEAVANALMKCETKATRRAVLRLMGLGMIDETEAETLPGESVNIVVTETAISALDADLSASGKLTVAQRKECIAWMREHATPEILAFIGMENADEQSVENAANDLGIKAAACLETLGIEDDDAGVHLDDCCDAAILDAKEKMRRTAAAATVAGNRSPKGGKPSASVETSTEVQSATTQPGTSKPTAKPAPKPAAQSASTTSATSGVEKAASASNAAAIGAPKTPDAKPDVLQALRGTVPKPSQLNGSPPTATKPAATVGVKPPVNVTSPVGGDNTANIAALNAHLNANPDTEPSVNVEGEMLKAIAVQNGWTDKQRGFVMLNIFGIRRNDADPQHPINFTRDAVIDMSNWFFAKTPEQARIDGLAIPE